MNPIDMALQSVCPTVMVPRHEALTPLTRNGHRYLAAADGLWIEAHLPWLHVRWPVAQAASASLPYGCVEREIRLSFGCVPRTLVDAFIAEARRTPRVEIAGMLVWSSASGAVRYERLSALASGASHITYAIPPLPEGDWLVADLHSHGEFDAFFSAQDNADDRSAYKFAGVVGHCERESPRVRMRLCVAGTFIDVPYDAQQAAAEPPPPSTMLALPARDFDLDATLAALLTRA